jgi:hypothetical protein
MISTSLIGALLILCGLVYMAGAAIYRGRMSDPRPNPTDTTDRTLEPRHRGLRFLGLKPNLAGLAIIVFGILLLVLPLLFRAAAVSP